MLPKLFAIVAYGTVELHVLSTRVLEMWNKGLFKNTLLGVTEIVRGGNS